jgi:hypothetical protein
MTGAPSVVITTIVIRAFMPGRKAIREEKTISGSIKTMSVVGQFVLCAF